jgi:hypothetical protein
MASGLSVEIVYTSPAYKRARNEGESPTHHPQPLVASQQQLRLPNDQIKMKVPWGVLYGEGGLAGYCIGL